MFIYNNWIVQSSSFSKEVHFILCLQKHNKTNTSTET